MSIKDSKNVYRSDSMQLIVMSRRIGAINTINNLFWFVDNRDNKGFGRSFMGTEVVGNGLAAVFTAGLVEAVLTWAGIDDLAKQM